MALPATDDTILILHNPRCSKSRAARAILEERGARFEQRLYLEQPLSRAELEDLAGRLGRPVREWTRQGESAFAEAGLSEGSLEDDWLAAIAAHPILMERPIVVRGGRALVGRPPESIVALLDD